MTKRAQLPDGRVLEFPDDTPDDVIDRVAKAEIANPRNDSAGSGFFGGALKPVDNLAEWASQIPVVGPAVDNLGVALGFPSTADAVANNEAMRRNNTRKGWQTVGNIAGTLPLARLPGGLATQGAASGAVLSDQKDATGIATDALVGGATSLGVGTALNSLAGAIQPRVARGVRKLAEAGVTMTPGQILSGSRGIFGRGLSKLEEAATSVPLIGDMITMAREQGSESLQRALGNRALGNINAAVPDRVPSGITLADYVGQRLGRAYDRLVPNLSATFDQQFADDLGGAMQHINPLPKASQQKFRGILEGVFGNRAQGTGISGQMLKDAESRLTQWIKQYSGPMANGDDRALAEGLKVARESLRGSINRSNPQYARELQNLNRGWAQARVMRRASEATPEGVPSPARLFQEQRRSGYRDPLVTTAAARLRNNTPDSGTARRGLAGLALTGGIPAVAGAVANPAFAIPALASALYTRGGLKALNKAVFAPRGPVAQNASKAIRNAARVSAPITAGLLGLFTTPPDE